MGKVFPAAEEIAEMKEKTLAGLKGETLSFQIAYYWGEEMKKRGSVKVLSPIADKVEVRTVNLVPCGYPCHMRRDEGYLATEPGMYPDLLKPISKWGFPLVSGQWRCLWVDVRLGADMEAGSYPVKLLLESEDERLCEAEVMCEVLDISLPKLPIPHTEWFHSDCLANYYHTEVFSGKYWELVENFVRTAVEHKCNMLLTPIFTPPIDTAEGGERPTVQLVDITVSGDTYLFGFDRLHRWVEMALRCGMEYFEISHLFTQWGAKAAPKIMAVKDGVLQRIFGWETEAAGPEYENFLHQFLPALKKELKELGIMEKCYFHISDEPQKKDLEFYRKACGVVAEDLKDCKVIDALSDYEFYEKGLVRKPICSLDHMKPFLENRPEELWGYYCTAQCEKVSNRYIVLPGCRTRILGTLLYKYQINGFLHWGYNFYNSEYSYYPIDPYSCTDAEGTFPSGDPFLVYPGPDGKPEGSVRLMLMDEAMSDYCALKALEALVGRGKVMEYVDEGVTLTFDEYPQDESYLCRLRGNVNQAIKDALKEG